MGRNRFRGLIPEGFHVYRKQVVRYGTTLSGVEYAVCRICYRHMTLPGSRPPQWFWLLISLTPVRAKAVRGKKTLHSSAVEIQR